MKTARKIKLLSVLISVAFLVQNASAAAPEYLPGSSHYQGRSYYDHGALSGRVDFAVYDTQTYPDQLVGADGRNEDLPWWDDTDTEENNLDKYRYVYAYQIFVDNRSFNIIDYFAILGLGKNAVAKDPSTDKLPTGSMDDIVTPDAVAPDDDPYLMYSATSGSYMVAWEFTNGFLTPGDHSWFLVLGSNQDWIGGMYTFDKTVGDGVLVSNPEPGSMALFGIGGMLTFIRTRKKFRKT